MCAGTVTECESALAQQKANDLAEAERAEEELKLKEVMARRAVEQEGKERQERLRDGEAGGRDCCGRMDACCSRQKV